MMIPGTLLSLDQESANYAPCAKPGSLFIFINKVSSVGEWINVVHVDSGMLFNIKRKWAVRPWKDMEEP